MDVDLLVRTFNTLYARGARRRGWPEYPQRLALAAEKVYEDWPHQVGLIGLQEAGGTIGLCLPAESTSHSVTSCFAAHLGRRFGAPVRFVEHHELGAVWDGDTWEAAPGGDGWRIGRRRILVSRRGIDLGADRFLLGVKLRQRATRRVVTFFNTHLANAERRMAERARQIERLLAIVDRQVGPGELPPILVGDFNLTPDERTTYDRLNRRFWLANVEDPDERPEERLGRIGIDHIWIGRSEHFRQTSGGFQVVRVHRSDGSDLGLELRRYQISDHPLVSIGFKIIEPAGT